MEKSIQLIQFTSKDWQPMEQQTQRCIWTNQDQDIASLNFIAQPPELPGALVAENLPQFRAKYRQMSAGINAGIVSVELIQLHQLSALQVIIKVPQAAGGYSYLASVTLPFTDCSFVIKFECKEQGMLGIREQSLQPLHDEQIQPWQIDPYDPKIENALYTASDDVQHDELFPDHPLSRARYYLSELAEVVVFDPSLQHATPFGSITTDNPWWQFWK